MVDNLLASVVGAALSVAFVVLVALLAGFPTRYDEDE